MQFDDANNKYLLQIKIHPRHRFFYTIGYLIVSLFVNNTSTYTSISVFP